MISQIISTGLGVCCLPFCLCLFSFQPAEWANTASLQDLESLPSVQRGLADGEGKHRWGKISEGIFR